MQCSKFQQFFSYSLDETSFEPECTGFRVHSSIHVLTVHHYFSKGLSLFYAKYSFISKVIFLRRQSDL